MVTTDVLVSTDGNKGLISLMNQSLAQPTSYRPWRTDFGIHAEMTAFLVWLDLCITMRSGAWEPAPKAMCTWLIWPITTASGKTPTEAFPAPKQFTMNSLRVSPAPHEKHPARPLQQTRSIKKVSV